MRVDNRPEFVAWELRNWLEERGDAGAIYRSKCPWQNGLIESFNGKFRDELGLN
jgi:putative transposase